MSKGQLTFYYLDSKYGKKLSKVVYNNIEGVFIKDSLIAFDLFSKKKQETETYTFSLYSPVYTVYNKNIENKEWKKGDKVIIVYLTKLTKPLSFSISSPVENTIQIKNSLLIIYTVNDEVVIIPLQNVKNFFVNERK